MFTFEGRAWGQFVVIITGRISQRRFCGVRLFVLVNGGFFVLYFVVWHLVNGLLPHLNFLLQIYKKKTQLKRLVCGSLRDTLTSTVFFWETSPWPWFYLWSIVYIAPVIFNNISAFFYMVDRHKQMPADKFCLSFYQMFNFFTKRTIGKQSYSNGMQYEIQDIKVMTHLKKIKFKGLGERELISKSEGNCAAAPGQSASFLWKHTI